MLCTLSQRLYCARSINTIQFDRLYSDRRFRFLSVSFVKVRCTKFQHSIAFYVVRAIFIQNCCKQNIYEDYKMTFFIRMDFNSFLLTRCSEQTGFILFFIVSYFCFHWNQLNDHRSYMIYTYIEQFRGFSSWSLIVMKKYLYSSKTC